MMIMMNSGIIKEIDQGGNDVATKNVASSRRATCVGDAFMVRSIIRLVFLLCQLNQNLRAVKIYSN